MTVACSHIPPSSFLHHSCLHSVDVTSAHFSGQSGTLNQQWAEWSPSAMEWKNGTINATHIEYFMVQITPLFCGRKQAESFPQSMHVTTGRASFIATPKDPLRLRWMCVCNVFSFFHCPIFSCFLLPGLQMELTAHVFRCSSCKTLHLSKSISKTLSYLHEQFWTLFPCDTLYFLKE